MSLPANVSPVGRKLIKDFEGCHTILSNGKVQSYVDPVGVWTIGWGHTKTAKPNMIISQTEANKLFEQDLGDVISAIHRHVKVPLTQNQFDALASFVYNLGETNFRKSTLLKRLNAGLYEEVPAQLLRWNKGRVKGKLVVLKGLTRRRTAEAAVFSANEDTSELVKAPRRVEADAPKPKRKSRKFWGSITAGVSSVAGWFASTAEGLMAPVQDATNSVAEYLPFVPQLETVFVVLAVAGVALAIFAQFDDDKKAAA